MSQGRKTLSPLIQETLSEMLGEDILIEAARDMIKDEIKRSIKEKLEENPELRQELKDAVKMYFEAKVKETFAGVKMAKATAKLGLEMIPEDLKMELSAELEKDLGEIIEKMLGSSG